MSDHMPAHLRIAASAPSSRQAARQWLAAAVMSSCAACAMLAWWPAGAAGAACAVIVLAGLWQLSRSHSWERSLRAGSGMAMICAGMWGILLAATGRADWPMAAATTAAAMISAWLVWAPHSHPALLRHTTGFGDLDDAATAAPGPLP